MKIQSKNKKTKFNKKKKKSRMVNLFKKDKSKKEEKVFRKRTNMS